MKTINNFINESLNSDFKEAKPGQFFAAVLNKTHVGLLITPSGYSNEYPTGKIGYVIEKIKYSENTRYSSGYESKSATIDAYGPDLKNGIEGDKKAQKAVDQKLINNGWKLILLNKKKYNDLLSDISLAEAIWWRAPSERGILETTKSGFDGENFYLNMWLSRKYRHADEYSDNLDEDVLKKIEDAEKTIEKIRKIFKKYKMPVHVSAWQ